MSVAGPIAALLLLVIVVPTPASGQDSGAAAPPAGELALDVSGVSGIAADRPSASEMLASALLPGTGQILSGRRRGWVALGLDAAFLTGWAVERSRGLRDRDAYRGLAVDDARGGAKLGGVDDFEYFERMARWIRSGTFDASPEPGVQPETRLDTFNGDAWRLARSIHLGGGPADPSTPGWNAAIDYYSERAYRPALAWDWSANLDSQRRYGELIRDSDDHLKRAGWALAGAIGLRVVAVLDLYVASRSEGRLGLEVRSTHDRSIEFRMDWIPNR